MPVPVFTELRRIQQQFPNRKVAVDETYDGVKMSEVLKAFVAPFRNLAETEEAFLKLLAIAVTAWNIALSPAKERDGHTREVLEALPQDARSDARMIIGELIEWKEERFSQYKHYHLIVISTAHELEEQ